MARYTVAVLVCVLAASADPQSLYAQSSDSAERQRTRRAKRYLDRGLAYYEQRQFERAIAEFLTGYEIDPQPQFLFALGQSERRSGDCASARVYYQRFLATSPPARQVAAANMQLRACRAALQNGPGSERPAPSPEPVQPVFVAPVADASPAPWYHDLLGDSLLALGTASVATGVILVVKSRSDAGRAGWAETYPEYDTALKSARQSRLLGITALAAGTALVAGAAYRFHRSRQREERFALVPDIQPLKGGLAVGLGGRF